MAETQQRSQGCIRVLPGFDRARLLMIETGQSVMLLLLDKEKAESGTNQRAETNQTFKRSFQIRTGHHRVAHDLKTTGMESPVGFQTDIQIIRSLSSQVPKTIDNASLAECSWFTHEPDIQSRLAAQNSKIQSLGQKRIRQHAGITRTHSIHGVLNDRWNRTSCPEPILTCTEHISTVFQEY
ncbi:hypothetical protein D3C71_1045170 [compost metagenome]